MWNVTCLRTASRVMGLMTIRCMGLYCSYRMKCVSGQGRLGLLSLVDVDLSASHVSVSLAVVLGVVLPGKGHKRSSYNVISCPGVTSRLMNSVTLS